MNNYRVPWNHNYLQSKFLATADHPADGRRDPEFVCSIPESRQRSRMRRRTIACRCLSALTARTTLATPTAGPSSLTLPERDICGDGAGDGDGFDCPFVDWTKTEPPERGPEFAVPDEITWSCYREEAPACGTCDACAFRLQVFQRAGGRCGVRALLREFADACGLRSGATRWKSRSVKRGDYSRRLRSSA